jgi:colanic acid/amylovoran biosynthesis protein
MRLHWPFKAREALSEAVERADVLVHSGGGIINDEFIPNALQRLDLIDKATTAGKPTAMFSQGIGPIGDAVLATKAAKVLPSVNHISLRESVGSLPTLLSLGVNASRITATGDDAIALAYPRRAIDLGEALGVSIRLARYAGLSSTDRVLLESLRTALVSGAETQNATLASIPIAADDHISLRVLMKDGMGSASTTFEKKNLTEVLQSVSRCRVIVSGSYHAAVFALSQGIPAICLVRSGYYAQKFLGLADQFGEGCEVLFMDEKRFGERLNESIAKSWNRASRTRPLLLDAARRQTEASTAAYQRFFEIVGVRKIGSS